MRFTLPWFLLTMIALSILPLYAAQPPAAKTATAKDSDDDPLPSGVIVRIGTMQLRHDAPVAALVWSHDGSFLASASHDKTVCM